MTVTQSPTAPPATSLRTDGDDRPSDRAPTDLAREPGYASSPATEDVLDFVLPTDLEAHEPPEAAGRARDGVRLLVSPGLDEPIDTHVSRLPDHLVPGDLLVVNTSSTIPAALDGRLPDGEPVAVHLATPLADGTWLVEVRRFVGGTTEPLGRTVASERVDLPDGAWFDGLVPWRTSHRLTVGELHLTDELLAYLDRYGRAIRYQHVPVPWPIDAYQTVFAEDPGSVEMPSASRPFTADLVTRLVSRGIGITPITLHTGVSSLEGDEDPYPERFEVPATTAHRVDDAHRDGRRVIALGTTVVRALESAVGPDGRAVAARGWTERVVSPTAPPLAVDALITGWHEPRSSHLRLLEAVAGGPALETAYDRAIRLRYRWHEFGDLHLILPG